MSDGLGAGFFRITLLAALGGVALLLVEATGIAVVFRRRTDRIPTPLRWVVTAACLAAFVVGGFVVLALFDEAPPLAGLFAVAVVFPFLTVGTYLERTTDLSRVDTVATTGMAWGLLFLTSVAVAFGARRLIASAEATAVHSLDA